MAAAPRPATAQSAAAQSGVAQPGAYDWLGRPPHAEGLHFSTAQADVFRRADPGVLALRPVTAADAQTVVGEGDAFGYAVGALLDSTLFVGHYARACHFGCEEKYAAGTSRAIVRHSTDAGRTWSPVLRLDHEVGALEPERAAIGWGIALGTDGHAVYAATARGLYVTRDRGATWAHVEGALAKGEAPGALRGAGKVHIGPNMLHSPKGGLILLGNSLPESSRTLYLLHSTDGGATWQQATLDTGHPGVTPVEPTAIMIGEDRFLVFSRNGVNHQGANPAQMVVRIDGPGRYVVEQSQVTNARVVGHQDTHDVIYNPVTDRFEALVSNRGRHYQIMEVTLWSIAREALLGGSATWRYEGDLWTGLGAGEEAEGTHPGGSVVDAARGKAYHFLHRGKSHDTSSSVYLVERTLRTGRLARLLPQTEVEDDG